MSVRSGMLKLPEANVLTGKLAENIVYFGRLLRMAGIPVGPSRVVDAVRAVGFAGVHQRDDVYWALHAVFTSKREHNAVFDAAFDMFWQNHGGLMSGQAMQSNASTIEKPKAAAARISQAMLVQQFARHSQMKPDLEVDAKYTVAGAEVLQSKDFAQMDVEEIEAAKQAIKNMVLPVSKVKMRRFKTNSTGSKINMRQTLRASLATGGEWVKPVMQSPRTTQPPIVALVDISGSMGQYSRLFLHFLHALSESQNRVHSFVFGTRLTNITRALARKDPDEALEACGAYVKDWSGGTRIATALHEFNKSWSRRVLGQGATVLLITDGLERDGDENLGFEMNRLQKSCRQLIWLNPLLRFDKFEARASGVRTMLPFVDQFRAVHSLEAMSDLCRCLSQPDKTFNKDPKSWLSAAA